MWLYYCINQVKLSLPINIYQWQQLLLFIIFIIYWVSSKLCSTLLVQCFSPYKQKAYSPHDATFRKCNHSLGGNLTEQREVSTNFLSAFFFKLYDVNLYALFLTFHPVLLYCEESKQHFEIIANMFDIFIKVLFGCRDS